MSHFSVCSSSSSLFSESSSTSSSSTFPSPTVQKPESKSLKKKEKGTSIHLPFQLPTPKLSNLVDLDSLLLDGDYAGRPIGFILAHLRSLGPSLLTSCTRTNIHIPMTPELPSQLFVNFPPLPAHAQFRPTHILALTALDSEKTLLMPIYGLLWAAASPALACLSSNGGRNEGNDIEGSEREGMLPVAELRVPSLAAAEILQGWIYLRSSNVLLSSLLPKSPPSFNSNSLSAILNPSATNLSHQLSYLPRSILLEKIELIHSLWKLVVSLEIGGDDSQGIWNGMRIAWEVLVGALAVREASTRGGKVDSKEFK